MATRVPRARSTQSVGEVRRRLAGADRYDSAADVAVFDDDCLVGLARIEDLLAASADTSVAAIMDRNPLVVAPGVDQERAARQAATREESSVAVVEADGRFLGLIPPHRMLGVLLEEHREDLARISGYLHQSASARAVSEEGVVRRLWHRFPFLLVGLVAARAAAGIVAGFERGLSARLELAFFMPGIVYIAGAVGTQTETLIVRGLSVGVSVRRVMWRELATGVALGAMLGALAFPAVAYWFDTGVACTVAASIWAASSAATDVAMALPWSLSHLALDPAFGSGPLSTVMQDLLSLAVHFWFAGIFVT